MVELLHMFLTRIFDPQCCKTDSQTIYANSKAVRSGWADDLRIIELAECILCISNV